jgi:hypothetical protein
MNHDTSPSNETEPPARELAKRQSGSEEILLLWHPGGNRIELLVHDPETGAGVLVEIPPDDALDAFHHPFAYTTQGEPARLVVEPSGTVVDG